MTDVRNRSSLAPAPYVRNKTFLSLARSNDRAAPCRPQSRPVRSRPNPSHAAPPTDAVRRRPDLLPMPPPATRCPRAAVASPRPHAVVDSPRARADTNRSLAPDLTRHPLLPLSAYSSPSSLPYRTGRRLCPLRRRGRRPHRYRHAATAYRPIYGGVRSPPHGPYLSEVDAARAGLVTQPPQTVPPLLLTHPSST